MFNRLLQTCSAVFVVAFAGCAHQPPEYRWVKAATRQTDHDRDMAAAREEAWKAYPKWKNLPSERQAALRKKFPKKSEAQLDEYLAEMRHSVESLYMDAHGWHLITIDSKGRVRGARTH